MDGPSCAVRCAIWLACLFGLSFSAALGQEAEPPFRSSVQLGPRNGSGMYRYYPGRWNTIHFRLTNHLDRDALLQSTAYVGDDPSMQTGRVQWLPPHAAMDTSYPLWIPASSESKREVVELQTQVSESGGSGEQLVRDSSGKLTTSNLVPLTAITAATGFIGPAFDPATEREQEAIRKLIAACRYRHGLPWMVHEFADSLLPAVPEAFSQLDELIVAADRVCDDEATIAAIQEWVTAGGRLWIMLDRVDARTVERLLGDRCDLAEIDRVGLNTFTVMGRTREQDVSYPSGEHELPVSFVRVSMTRAKVDFRIDGWPAVFWYDYGAGRVLITTLGARGWLQARQGKDPQATGPAEEWAGTFFSPRAQAETLPTELRSVVEGYIGYSIPDQRLIIGVLGGFAFVLFLAIFAFRKRLEWMGIIAPAVGLAAAAALVLTGFRNQHAVGATIAQLQIAEPVPGGEALRVRGITGLYSPDGQRVPLSGEQGGRMAPDMTGLAGTNRRLIWTDSNRWHWENIHQPGGLRLSDSVISTRSTTPIRNDAMLGPDGVHGQLQHGLAKTPEDVVLLTSSGRFGVTLDEAGKFTAGSGDVLGPGQYVAADVLTDAQRRRSKVLETLSGGAARGTFPHRPTLAYWTAPLDGGLRFGDGWQELGEALVLSPIEFHRPAAGTEFVIPSPLVSIREGLGPDGSVPQGLITPLTGEWQERTGPVRSWLKLQLPSELTPLELQSLNVVVRVSGKVGQLKLSARKDGRLHTLQEWASPVGTLRAELTDVSSLSVAPDGTVLIAIQAGEADKPGAESFVADRKDYWRIESMEIGLRGRVPPVGNAP